VSGFLTSACAPTAHRTSAKQLKKDNNLFILDPLSVGSEWFFYVLFGSKCQSIRSGSGPVKQALAKVSIIDLTVI
jgi:hypothetical protein